ncbi:hypothetical protein ED733_007505 [Metarhizium rileyi]|uniref:Uncharacterized protein n=1 Tax=Metarhizium rileyi (strain RCEF 4871) TaxID=1649241 RepID=A0A5C6GNC0_METRR|nr:hypothetical protein ED733_007505 [Metarhizium rileyi]
MERPHSSPPPPFTLRTTPEGLQKVKLWTRSISVSICIILFGAGIKLKDVPGVIIILLTPACVTLVWNATTILAQFLRTNRQDVHPGARVGVDLIIWLGFGAIAVMMAAAWSQWGSIMPETSFQDVKFILVQMSVVLATIEAFVHIALFIIACHETHVHNNRYKRFVHGLAAGGKDKDKGEI